MEITFKPWTVRLRTVYRRAYGQHMDAPADADTADDLSARERAIFAGALAILDRERCSPDVAALTVGMVDDDSIDIYLYDAVIEAVLTHITPKKI